jgi:hypothetical protein
MIDQILKDHKPGEKPRFFLHNEMKAWLGDNLDIQVIHGENRSTDYSLQSKLGLNNTLPVGHHLSITLSIDKEPITVRGINLPMTEYEHALRCLANVTENCMKHINQLQLENLELRRRLDLIENPLPL